MADMGNLTECPIKTKQRASQMLPRVRDALPVRLAWKKDDRAENRERIRERHRAWMARNPEKRELYNANARLRRKRLKDASST